MLVDAHCHLQDEKIFPISDTLINQAASLGIAYIVCCGTSEKDWHKLVALKERYPQQLVVCFGLHPWYISERATDWLAVLENYLQKVPSCVGEIGLDYALDYVDKEDQQTVLIRQIELAQKYRVPVSIHCRRAWEGIVSVLKQTGPILAGGLIHSYSGSSEMVSTLAAYNLSFSFSGSITYENNRRGRKALQSVPDERLLIETDSPDIVPKGVTKKVNEPANLKQIAQCVADIKKKELLDFEELIMNNSNQLFKPYR